MSNSGFAVWNAVSAPPTIKVSVPAEAPPIPPETGASKLAILAALAISLTSLALCTSTVEQSRKMLSARISGIIWAATDFRISPFGSMVITISAPVAAAAAEFMISTPSACTLTASNPRTMWPACARFSAIGRPIFPRPINPICI